MQDPYLYPNSDVLINKLNISNFNQLQEAEKTIYLHKSNLPLPEGHFDYDHLKAIHQHFFESLYEWAGKERIIDISKGNSYFGNHQFIERELQKIFLQLAQDNYLKPLPIEEFIPKLSYYFNEINAAHPFREGNGRTLRAFCELLSKNAGYDLDWTKSNREEYIQASITGFEGSHKEMEKVFAQICSKNSLEIKTIYELSQETHKLIEFYLEQYVIFNEAVDQKVAHIGENPALQKEFAKLSREAYNSMLSMANALSQKEDFKSLHDFIEQENKQEIGHQNLPIEKIKEKFSARTLSTQEVLSLFKKITHNAIEFHQTRNQSLSLEEGIGYSY